MNRPVSITIAQERGTCQPRARKRWGFTLVELLVVVAIIALLIAILLPSLRKAREQGKRTKCAANLKSIAQGCQMYADENQGRFLRGPRRQRNFGGRQGTHPDYGGDPANPVEKPLNPQLKLPFVLRDGGESFACPADKGDANALTSTAFEYYGTSYSTNQYIIGQDTLPYTLFGPCRPFIQVQINPKLKKLNRSQIVNDSSLLLVGDGGWWEAFFPTIDDPADWHMYPRHHNLAFMDTHVEFLRIRKGLHVTSQYTVVPFQDLQDEACRCQKEL